MFTSKDKDLVIESLIINETILSEMLEESSDKDSGDIAKLDRIRKLIARLQEDPLSPLSV